MARENGLLEGNDLVETAVGVEAGFDVGEESDGAVSTSTTVMISSQYNIANVIRDESS